VTSSMATVNGVGWKGKEDNHYSEEDYALGKPN
jgi:hypothetical protein